MTPEPSIQITNLHYFFSTSPQVLGAMLAITGAFVVFRFNRLRDELRNSVSRLMDALFEEGEFEIKREFQKYYGSKYEGSEIAFEIMKGNYTQDYTALVDRIKNLVKEMDGNIPSPKSYMPNSEGKNRIQLPFCSIK